MFDAPQDLIYGPAMQAPPGVIPLPLGRTSPDQKWYFICVPLFTLIPGFFVLLRLYTKVKIVRKVDLTDYLVIMAFLIFIASLGIGRLIVYHGAAVHLWNLPLYNYMRMLFWLNIDEALYCPCIFLIKTAIVLQYLQILCPSRTGNELIFFGGWGIIGAMFTFYICDVPLTLFICNPREKIWNDYYKGGKCMDYNALVLASALFNIFSDLVILLLPVRSVWKLRINAQKKVGIILLFGTGLLATICSAMRVPYMIKLNNQGKHQDISYEMVWMGLWSWAEIAMGIIVACTLSLPKLFRAKSKQLGFLLSIVTSSFSSLRSRFYSKHSRSASNASEEFRFPLTMVEGQPPPRATDYVHAPPGLTIHSDIGSFVVVIKKDLTVVEERC